MGNNIYSGKFGLERETLRVTKEGKMAQTDHPFSIDSLSRDFCENQLEIITPVCSSIEEAVSSLKNLSDTACEILHADNEYLWMYSNPPHMDSEDEIPIAKYEGAYFGKQQYRMKLERRYGKKLMTYSGIHFNLSFDKAVIGDDANEFYMKLLKYSISYSWLITLLTAASPVYDASLDEKSPVYDASLNWKNEERSAFNNYASMRNGKRGYWNQFVPILDYSNVENYCRSIRKYIEKGVLFSEGELYLPVRIKPKGLNNLDRLKTEGVDHIELRMFDLNPLSPVGVFCEDLKFACLLLRYFADKDDFEFHDELQRQAIENQKNSAVYDLTNITIEGVNIIEKASELLGMLREYYAGNADAERVIDVQRNKLIPGNRYAEIIYVRYKNDFQNKMLACCVERANV